MRSNDTVQVTQASTFIGCSNKSLEQLIRDETGGRRFAELVWRMDADWDAMNATDWLMLWQSVDENGPDPMDAMRPLLAEQQERNRFMGPVETWVRALGHQHKSWSSASDLHGAYRLWEEDNFPGFRTDLNKFGRDLKGLIKNQPDFPMETKRSSDGVKYRHV